MAIKLDTLSPSPIVLTRAFSGKITAIESEDGKAKSASIDLGPIELVFSVVKGSLEELNALIGKTVSVSLGGDVSTQEKPAAGSASPARSGCLKKLEGPVL